MDKGIFVVKLNVILLAAFGVFFVGCGSGGSNAVSHGSSSNTLSVSSGVSSSVSSNAWSGVTPSWFPDVTQNSLAKLHIDTVDDLPIVSKETYVLGSFELIEDELTLESGNLSIRGRGNSTWTWAKKPFRLKLDQPTELLGMANSKHWVLLANYADKTLVRNDIAFTFSRLLGFEYTVDDRYVELYLNDEYYGIYQLTEQIRLAKNRLNIDELTPEDIASEVISGGYLMELDSRMALDFCIDKSKGSNAKNSETCLDGVNLEREKTFCIESSHGMSPICLKDPDDLQAAERASQQNYIAQTIEDFESALFSDMFTDATLGYSAYLDMDSAVNYYIANEFFKNVEGGSNSFFMYKKREGKLFFGPIWDFDIAMGSNLFSGGINPEGWVIRNNPWFARLTEDPEFVAQVKSKWSSLKDLGVMQQLLAYPQARTQWISPFQKANFLRWPLDGVLVNNDGVSIPWLAEYSDFDQEALELHAWLNARFNWMDQQMLIQ